MLQGQRHIREDWQSAEAIPLDVLFEDEEVIVVNKPAGWWCTPARAMPTAPGEWAA